MKSEFMIICLLLSAMAMQTAFGNSTRYVTLDPDIPSKPQPRVELGTPYTHPNGCCGNRCCKIGYNDRVQTNKGGGDCCHK